MGTERFDRLRRISEFLLRKPHIIDATYGMAGKVADEHCVELVIQCPSCRKNSLVEVTEEDLLRWIDLPIQEVWPDVNLREQLMSGFHSACWDAL